ncbi:phage tail protein, partial [Xenorhabdus bovienii]|uniref:phage tail protein n=2 Tax=Xenorhabdus bovienii TaxID=40576 RepID=UPI0030B9F9F2
IADGANVLTNEEYGKLAARTNGFSSGVAKSQELNKVWRQASVIASVVAQFIAETNNQDVLDDGNTAALRAGLLNALRATVGANIPVASQTVAGIAKLSNATNSEAENVAATPKAVKQAADMANQARTEAGNANATANTANQNAGNAITNANTANQNATNANDNANKRLEKNQNGADIPNKPKFVENLGLAETKKQAENAYPKTGGVVTGHVDATGSISGKGVYEYPSVRVYSAVNKPSPGEIGALPASGTAVSATQLAKVRTIAGVPFDGTADIAIPAGNVGAYTKAEVDRLVREQTATLLGSHGWRKDINSGLILQWGLVTRTGDKTAVEFPVHFSEKCFNIQLTLGNAYSNSSSNIVAENASKTGFVYIAYSQEVWSYWSAVGY